MWFHITDDRAEADRIVTDRLVPAIGRPEAMLRERLPVGPAGAFAEKLHAFREAGVQQVLVWPVADEVRQLELFCDQVVPRIARPGPIRRRARRAGHGRGRGVWSWPD
jgi:hypothetical protein